MHRPIGPIGPIGPTRPIRGVRRSNSKKLSVQVLLQYISQKVITLSGRRLLQYRAFLLHYRARNTYSIGRLLHYRLVQGAIQVLRNAIFLEIGPHPPPRNANNIEHITPS